MKDSINIMTCSISQSERAYLSKIFFNPRGCLEKLLSDGECGEEGLIESPATSSCSGSIVDAAAAFSVSAVHYKIIKKNF